MLHVQLHVNLIKKERFCNVQMIMWCGCTGTSRDNKLFTIVISNVQLLTERSQHCLRLKHASAGYVIRAINQWRARQAVGVRWLSTFLIVSHCAWVGLQLPLALQIDGEPFSQSWRLTELIPVMDLLDLSWISHTRTNFDHRLIGRCSVCTSVSLFLCSIYISLLPGDVALGLI